MAKYLLVFRAVRENKNLLKKRGAIKKLRNGLRPPFWRAVSKISSVGKRHKFNFNGRVYRLEIQVALSLL